MAGEQQASKKLKTSEDDVRTIMCTALENKQHPLIKVGLANEKKLLDETKLYTKKDPLYNLFKEISKKAETTVFSDPTIHFQGKAKGTGDFAKFTYIFAEHQEQYDELAEQNEEEAKKKYENTFSAETKVYEWKPCVNADSKEYDYTPGKVLKRVDLMLKDRLKQVNSKTCTSDYAQMVDGKMDPKRRIEYVDNTGPGGEVEEGKAFARHVRSLKCVYETLKGITEADVDKAKGKKTMAGGIALMRGQYYESMTHFSTAQAAKLEFLRLAALKTGIDVPAVSLGIVNANASEWCGSLTLEYHDGHLVDGRKVQYNNMNGYHITPETRQYAFGYRQGWKKISSNALFIILVEGGSVYQTFINCKIWEWIPCILICTHGMSKDNSIAFGTMLSEIFDIPFYGGGLDVNGNGFLNLALYYSRHRPDTDGDDKSLACDYDKLFCGVRGRVLSLRPSELVEYGITDDQYQIAEQKMTVDDVNKARNKLENGKFFEFGNKIMRVAEINTWLKLGYKIEFDIVKKQKMALMTIEKLIIIQLYGEHDTKLNKSKYNLFV